MKLGFFPYNFIQFDAVNSSVPSERYTTAPSDLSPVIYQDSSEQSGGPAETVEPEKSSPTILPALVAVSLLLL